MAFPINPSINQLHTVNTRVWSYNGYAWESYNIGLTGPTGPQGIPGPTGPTGAAGSTTLDGLSDVTITGAQNNDILIYNSSTSQWVNASVLDGGTF